MKSLMFYLRISGVILAGFICFSITSFAINTVTPVKEHDKNDPQYKLYLEMKSSLTVRSILSLDATTIHVSTTGNDLTGDGCLGNPFLSIQKGVDEAKLMKEAIVLHAGTKCDNNKLVTSGGRVMGIVGMGKPLKEAIKKTYEIVNKIHFDKMQHRKDIGAKALK